MDQFQSETKSFVEDLKSGQNNILVTIRVRPLSNKEKSISELQTIKILDHQLLLLMEPDSNPDDVLRKNRNKDTQFAFDYVFDIDSTQQLVYEHTTEFLLDGLLEGYNTTVFSYGATGSGKTYTMIGRPEDQGIMPRTMHSLFQKLNKDFTQTRIQLSYLEIYNENIKDLLNNEDKNLEIREDKQHGVTVAGITEVHVESVKDVMMLFKLGTKNRAKEATDANQESSRSHAILQLTIESKEKNQGLENQLTISKLSLVDLAGSERAANTNNKGLRMMEGAKINQSLLVLGNCIQALSEANEKNIRQPFIPYRNSKLTRLLKDSLGGNCRTVMISNISPATNSFEETYNTITYANRAKNIKTVANRNVLQATNHISNYAQIIQNLRQENEELKQLVSQSKIKEINLPPIQGSSNQIQQEISLCYKELLNLQKKIFDTEEYINEAIDHLKNLEEQKSTDILTQLKCREMAESQRQSINLLKKELHELQQKQDEMQKKRGMLAQQIKTNIKDDQILQNYLNGLVTQGDLQLENQLIKQKDMINKKKSQKQEEQIQELKKQIRESSIRLSPNPRQGSYFSYSQRKKTIKLPQQMLPTLEKRKSPSTINKNQYSMNLYQNSGLRSAKNNLSEKRSLRSKSAANQTIEVDQERKKSYQQIHSKQKEVMPIRNSIQAVKSRMNLQQSPYLINFIESKEMKQQRLERLMMDFYANQKDE